MPASDARTLRVRGLRDLQRAFALADKELRTDLRSRLKDAAEPVRADAERLASTRIRNIGLPWSRMRVGVTSSLVYVAPRERGRGSPSRRRRNLADLLMGRAMDPALEANEALVGRKVEELLEEVGSKWERV